MLFNFLKLKTSRQVILLFSAQVGGVIFGFIATVLITKQLNPIDFGVYSFLISLIGFFAIFFEFGYIASAGRLLTQFGNDSVEERQIVGAALFLGLLIGISLCITIFGFSFFADNIFHKKVGYLLKFLSIFSLPFTLQFFMELIMKGCNKIKYLAYFQIIWKILFLLSILLMLLFKHVSILYLVISYSMTCLLSFLYFIANLSPSFGNLRHWIRLIYDEAKRYGFHIYIGRIIDSGTFQLDTMLIPLFSVISQVGFYNLAYAMASPVNFFSSALSFSKFKDFAKSETINLWVLIVNFVWIILAVSGFLFLGFILVYFILPAGYHEVFLLLVILVFAVAAQAAYQPFNAWLSSQGYGRILKSKSIYSSIITLILNLSLIPPFGAIGAAFASLGTMIASLLLYIYYYKKVRK